MPPQPKVVAQIIVGVLSDGGLAIGCTDAGMAADSEALLVNLTAAANKVAAALHAAKQARLAAEGRQGPAVEAHTAEQLNQLPEPIRRRLNGA